MVIALHLPRLRFLRLALNLRDEEKPSEGYIPFESWVASNLASLIVSGGVGEAYYKDFLRFLHKDSFTVENLVMCLYMIVYRRHEFCQLDIHSLQRFPRLKGLGLGVIKDTDVLDIVYEDIPLRLSLLISYSDDDLQAHDAGYPLADYDHREAKADF